MGSKYEFKADRNPPPGLYSIEEADALTKPKTRSAIIREDFIQNKRKQEPSPDPGQYDNHLTPFASDTKPNVTMGSKYEFKADRNPPPGLYDPDASKELTSSRVRSALIREQVSPYRRPQDKTPDPG